MRAHVRTPARPRNAPTRPAHTPTHTSTRLRVPYVAYATDTRLRLTVSAPTPLCTEWYRDALHSYFCLFPVLAWVRPHAAQGVYLAPHKPPPSSASIRTGHPSVAPLARNSRPVQRLAFTPIIFGDFRPYPVFFYYPSLSPTVPTQNRAIPPPTVLFRAPYHIAPKRSLFTP